MTTEFRLLKLERRLPRRPPPSPALAGFDSSRLTMREQYELDQLYAHLAPLPGERPDFDVLTTPQVERMSQLTDKAYGVEPPRAYAYMRHRDAGSGPCLCGGATCRQQGVTS